MHQNNSLIIHIIDDIQAKKFQYFMRHTRVRLHRRMRQPSGILHTMPNSANRLMKSVHWYSLSMIQQSTCSTKRRGSLSFAALFQWEERKMYKFVYHIFPAIPSSLIEINTFWTKWETVKKGVRLLNEVKKRAAFLTEENSSWGRRVVGFEWKPLHVVPTLFMSNCKKTVEWFCCVCINNVRIIAKLNHSYYCHMWSSCERSEQLTHNIIDDFLIIRCTLTGIIMSCYDSRINQIRRDW